VKMTIPQHPFRAHWLPIEIEAFGYRFDDTIEAATLEAITTFCEQHPNEVAEYPIGLFPAVDYHDPSGLLGWSTVHTYLETQREIRCVRWSDL